ncbi:MAG: HEAT repeat domain-containing protein [Armatimonadota bacterium]
MKKSRKEPSLEERIEESTGHLRIWDARIRDRAIAELIRCGEAAVPALCGVLETEFEVARIAACRALQTLRAPQSVRWLCRTALDPSQDVALAAVAALRALRSPDSVYTLCELARRGGETGLLAVEALGSIGDPSATPAVLQMMRSLLLGGRERVIRVLGQLRDPRATLPLCEMLEQGSHAERVAAAEALGEIGDARAVAPLCQFLAYPVPTEIRHARLRAVIKIGALGAEPLARLLAYDDGTADLAEQALKELGPAAAGALAEMLGAPSSEGRRRAAALLGAAAVPDYAPDLVRALSDPNAAVRQEAALALGPLALPPVRAALRSAHAQEKEAEQVRACAGVSLAEHGDGSAEVIASLVEALHLERRIRERAARGLGRLAETEPSLALRGAVRRLRSLSRAWTLPREEKEIYRRALAQVEAATANRRDLPIPSERGRGRPDDLPRPAQPPQNGDDLPVPAESRKAPVDSGGGVQ